MFFSFFLLANLFFVCFSQNYLDCFNRTSFVGSHVYLFTPNFPKTLTNYERQNCFFEFYVRLFWRAFFVGSARSKQFLKVETSKAALERIAIPVFSQIQGRNPKTLVVVDFEDCEFV